MQKHNLFTNSKILLQRALGQPLAPWLVAIFFHCVGAYYSFGYHHPDEHFQILEWANYFLGFNPTGSGMPWEFAAQIRQWFQPLLHAGLMKFFISLNLYNPFTTAMIARELYAGLNLVALYALWKTFKERYAGFNANLSAWIIATLWFFPYIHCRTSSENLSGIFLTFAFAILLKINNEKRFFTIGVLFGFAFLARYQIALGLVGLGLYFLIQARKILPSHLKLAIGFILVVLFGAVLDRIGYGKWVFTPYTYFNVNLVKGVAATYNPYPFYQYFIWLLQLNPLASIPLLIGIYHYLKKIRMDPLIAFCSSFFILHCLMTNKEYRFLFPLFNFIPFMVVLGWASFKPFWWTAVNIPGIIASSFRVTSWTIWLMAAFNRNIDSSLGDQQRWLTNHDPNVTQYYQLPKDFKYQIFGVLDDLKPLYEKTQKPVWILWDDHPSNDSFEAMLQFLDQHCEQKEISIPNFVFSMRSKIPAIKRLPYQAVYFCEK